MENADIEDIVFGKTLRKLRKVREKSQEELAMDASLNRNYISLLELGQRRPSLKTLILLSKGLKMSLSSVITEFEEDFKNYKN